MGTVIRREYIEIPKDYWISSHNISYITKEEDAKAIKRNKKL